MSTLPAIFELIARAYSWQPRAEGDFIARSYRPDGSRQQDIVSEQELLSVDQRLPDVLRALHRRCGDDSVNTLGHLVRLTLHYWQGPFTVHTVTGDDYLVSKMHDLATSTTDDVYRLSVETYGVEFISVLATHPDARSACEEISYVTSFYDETLFVSTDWLESQFPGWKVRFDAGVALDYNGKELVDYVCVRETPLPTATLRGMSFE